MGVQRCVRNVIQSSIADINMHTTTRMTEPSGPKLPPGRESGNDQDRLVVLNWVAKSIVESQRGVHPEYVFTYLPVQRKAKTGEVPKLLVPKPVAGMNTTAWKNARVPAAQKWEA
jgi:hypothetical protein